MYLLDTNVCIDFIDARNEAVRQKIVGHVADGLGVSAITAAELLVGAKNSEDPKGDKEKAQRFLSIVRAHDFNLEAANASVRIVEQADGKRFMVPMKPEAVQEWEKAIVIDARFAG